MLYTFLSIIIHASSPLLCLATSSFVYGPPTVTLVAFGTLLFSFYNNIISQSRRRRSSSGISSSNDNSNSNSSSSDSSSDSDTSCSSISYDSDDKDTLLLKNKAATIPTSIAITTGKFDVIILISIPSIVTVQCLH